MHVPAGGRPVDLSHRGSGRVHRVPSVNPTEDVSVSVGLRQRRDPNSARTALQLQHRVTATAAPVAVSAGGVGLSAQAGRANTGGVTGPSRSNTIGSSFCPRAAL
jgi:hypothetical protein